MYTVPHVKFERRFLGKVFVTYVTLVLACAFVFVIHADVSAWHIIQSIGLLLDCGWRFLDHCHLILDHMIACRDRLFTDIGYN